ncbi:S24 family peptidase [Novosphingobium colocasiae]|uniref:Peptidase S24/S26A/S26B/S26C domain-containing protein n=2 Tax=Bacteria TaxID=2 RepID=A0A918PBB0_9SPHN|nr:S24 family peptidase [Novosphingobium colocasiae]GGY95963.1 hypothetical protein GCM10011614_08390 [Novosphingobium colocasiae]
MDTSDPRQRLLDLARASGVSLSALSRMIGKNAAYLQQFVKRGTPRKLEEDDRARLARFFGVAQSELGGSQDFSSSSGLRGEWLDVPRLDASASAGPGAVAADGRITGALRFSASWLRTQGLHADRLSAISVTGDSMEPTLRDGDEILVDCTPAPLRDGVHVVRLGDTLLVKRVAAGGGGRIALLSDNPAYRPIECAPGEAEIVGRVVWKGGRL